MRRDTASLQRRPFLTPIWLSAIAALAVMIFAASLLLAAWIGSTAKATTVVVIRHAEKDLTAGDNPPLTEAGRARAALLAHMFGSANTRGAIDAIYVSPTLRSRLTATPLATQLKLTLTVAPGDDPKGLVRQVLRDHQGGRILVVGHTDTIPAIIAELSGDKSVPELGDQEYGTMYIVTVPRIGRPNYLKLSY